VFSWVHEDAAKPLSGPASRADRLQQGRLVGLDDHQVVAVLVFGDAAGGLSLGVQGVL